MTVAELIERLKLYPQDWRVMYDSIDGEEEVVRVETISRNVVLS